MPRNRFEKLMKCIHFVNNCEVNDEEKKKDKVWKLRPWISSIQTNLARIEQEEFNSVDEMMVSFTGRSSLKQYLPNKPTPWGFKLWVRAGSKGMLYEFDVYQEQSGVKYALGLGGDTVLRMCANLPEHKGFKVAADNFFSSIDLAAELRKKGICFVGTIRQNRLKNCPLTSEEELSKAGRGAFDFKLDTSIDVAIVRWYDNRAVTLVSNYVSTEPVASVKRWDKKTKQYIDIPRPHIVAVYNSYMGGTDVHNYLVSLYKFHLKSRRWYLYIFYHTLMISTVNAFNLHRRDAQLLGERSMLLRRFIAELSQ